MKRQNPTIRPAKGTDLAAICALDAQYNRLLLKRGGEAASDNFRTQARKLYAQAMKNRAQVVMVAERLGRTRGFLHATREDGPGDLVRAPWGCIAAIVVDRRARRSGIGTALLQAVERWAADLGLTALQLGVHEFNPGAIRFYERRGYRPVMHLMQKESARPGR